MKGKLKSEIHYAEICFICCYLVYYAVFCPYFNINWRFSYLKANLRHHNRHAVIPCIPPAYICRTCSPLNHSVAQSEPISCPVGMCGVRAWQQSETCPSFACQTSPGFGCERIVLENAAVGYPLEELVHQCNFSICLQ